MTNNKKNKKNKQKPRNLTIKRINIQLWHVKKLNKHIASTKGIEPLTKDLKGLRSTF